MPGVEKQQQRSAPVRFVAISDTHSRHRELNLPAGDVLLHAGDFTQRGTLEEVRDFCQWLNEVSAQFKQVIVIGGNHDLCLDVKTDRAHAHEAFELLSKSCVLLNEPNEQVDVLGVRLFGSPIQPQLGRKYVAFARPDAVSQAVWESVPAGTDIILAHTPPQGHGDRVWGMKSIGCPHLLAACERVRPSAVVFGHVHGGYGVTKMNQGHTLCINAANMRPLRVVTGLNEPMTFEVTPTR